MSSRFYNNKTAVVTGGSSGIGRALALRLAQAGANVVLLARDRQRLADVMALMQAAKVRAEQRFSVISVDISDSAAVADAITQVRAADEVDILVNNAGVACCDRIENLTDAHFVRMMQVNYFGMVGVTRALLPYFRQRGSGTIVNVSSLTGAIGIAGYSAYAPSKAAVIAFSECLRNELSSEGIRVSVALPTDVDTPQLHEENLTKPPETHAANSEVLPMSAEEAAHLILRGVERGEFWILPAPLLGRLSYSLFRYFPNLIRSAVDSKVSKAKAKAKSDTLSANKPSLI